MAKKPKPLIGGIILDEINERGWHIKDVAQLSNQPIDDIRLLITGEIELTPTMARGLAAAFETSVVLWMNLGRIKDDGKD